MAPLKHLSLLVIQVYYNSTLSTSHQPPATRRTEPHNPSCTNSKSTRLHRFLCEDIKSGGRRILLPYLDSQSLLTMSECCTGTVQYHFHLGEIRICREAGTTVGRSRHLPTQVLLQLRALLRLLTAQVRDVRSIKLVGSSTATVAVMDAARNGCFLHLLELKILGGHFSLCSQAVLAVGQALATGSTVRLRVLVLEGVYNPVQAGPDSAAAVKSVFEALGRGTCGTSSATSTVQTLICSYCSYACVGRRCLSRASSTPS